MRRVIVHYDVQHLPFLAAFIYLLQEPYIFFCGMMVLTFPDNISGQHSKRGKQRSSPVPLIIKGLPFRNMGQ